MDKWMGTGRGPASSEIITCEAMYGKEKLSHPFLEKNNATISE